MHTPITANKNAIPIKTDAEYFAARATEGFVNTCLRRARLD